MTEKMGRVTSSIEDLSIGDLERLKSAIELELSTTTDPSRKNDLQIDLDVFERTITRLRAEEARKNIKS